LPAGSRSVNWPIGPVHAFYDHIREVAVARQRQAASDTAIIFSTRGFHMTATTPRKSITPQFVVISAAASILITLIAMSGAMMIAGSSGTGRVVHNPSWAVIIHVTTVIPALLLGVYIMLGSKGTTRHKMLGRIWATLMMTTAISSFWIKGMTGGIGPIHIFAVITLVSIPRAIWMIRKGDVVAHERGMTGTFIGLLIAGLFSFIPGRLLGDMILGAIS
jgi:uncharacterized membrane protein